MNPRYQLPEDFEAAKQDYIKRLVTAWDDPEVWAQKLVECGERLAAVERERDEKAKEAFECGLRATKYHVQTDILRARVKELEAEHDSLAARLRALGYNVSEILEHDARLDDGGPVWD